MINFNNIEHKSRSEIKFKRHFIKSAHVRIEIKDFDAENTIAHKKELEQALKSCGFKESKVIKRINVEMKKDGDLISGQKDVGLEFVNPIIQKNIQLLENSILFSDYDYKSFETFQSEFRNSINQIATVLDITKIKLVGFKKVNALMITKLMNYTDSTQFFKPYKFSLLASDLITNDIFTFSEQSLIIEKDKCKGAIKSVLGKSDDNSYESIIDFDFVEIVDEINLIDAIENSLKNLNDMIFDLFIWTLEPEMEKLLNQEVSCNE